MNIQNPIRLSNEADTEKLSEMSDRNFTSAWQTMTELLKRIVGLENKRYMEVISTTDTTLTTRVNGKNYKLKIEV